MPYQYLINALLKDGKYQCEQIIEKARADAEEIIKNAEGDAALQKQEHLAKIDSDIKKTSIAIINRARIEAGGKIIRAKYEIIEDILKRASERFLEIKNCKDYPFIFEKLFKEVLQDINSEARVLIDKDDVKLFKRFFSNISVEMEPVHGNSRIAGVEIISSKGSVKVKNTLNSRLVKIKPELILELNKFLFGEKCLTIHT